MSVVILDPTVEIHKDDQGAIVLIPDDDRQPLRLHHSDQLLVLHLQKGINISDSDLGKKLDTKRLNYLITELNKWGLIAGRNNRHSQEILSSELVTKVYDALANILSWPFNATFNAKQLNFVYWLILISSLAVNISLLLLSKGTLFSAAASKEWIYGTVIYLMTFPVIHEFCHAFVARSFNYPVSKVGIQLLGGLSLRPFTEVKKLMLSSSLPPQFWIPMAGVLGNILLANFAGLMLYHAEAGSSLSGILGVVTLMFNWRVLVDGGFNRESDASKALSRYSERVTGKSSPIKAIFVRGFYFIHLVSFVMTILFSSRYLFD